MSNSSMLWVVVAIVIVGGGIFWWMAANPAATNTNVAIEEGANSPAPGATDAPTGSGVGVDVNVGSGVSPIVTTITYSGTGFSPQNVTIKKGGTVTWKNESSANMWVASAQHPTHTVYDGTSRTAHCAPGYTGAKPFDQCAGSTGNYSYTFTKAGTFGYHDHLNAPAFGSIKVVE